MKITRSQLKTLITEEMNKQLIRESAVSKIADYIVGQGEDAHDWIKKNMRYVTKTAKNIGSDADDVVTDIVMAVDQALGTEMSRSTRIQKSLNKWEEDNNAKQAASDDATAARNSPEAIAARQADREYDAEMEEWREAGARVAAADRERNKPKPEALDVYTPGGVNSDPMNNRHRVNPGVTGTGNMGYGEGVELDMLRLLIHEEVHNMNVAMPAMEESGDAYPTSDGTIAGALAEELAVIKNDLIQKIQPQVDDMRNELNKGWHTNSDENLVMDALQRFDEAARSYAIEVAALLRNAEINDGTEAPSTESATEILVTMMRYGSVENMVEKFDSVLRGASYGTMEQIISSNQ